MNAVLKFILVLGVSGVGLFLCGKIFVDEPAKQTTPQDEWDRLTKAPVENATDQDRQDSSEHGLELEGFGNIAKVSNNEPVAGNATPIGATEMNAASSWESSPAEALAINSADLSSNEFVASELKDSASTDQASTRQLPSILGPDDLANSSSKPQIKALPAVESDPGSGTVTEKQDVAKVQNPFFNNHQNPVQDNLEAVANSTIVNVNNKAIEEPGEGSTDESMSMVESIRQQQLTVTNRFADSQRNQTGANGTETGETRSGEPLVVVNPMMDKTQPQMDLAAMDSQVPDEAKESIQQQSPPVTTFVPPSGYSPPVNHQNQVKGSFKTNTVANQVVNPAVNPAAPEVNSPVALQNRPTNPTVVRTQMPPQASTPAPQPRASRVVEERARQHIEYGNSLARRGAVFAARQEFIQSLRLIADSLDMASQSRMHTNRLAAGLQALAESDDFVSVDSEQQLLMNVRTIVETHDTRLVNPETADDMSPIQAMQSYYSYAADQMSQSVGQSQVAGQALHSLGKLLTTAARFDVSGKPMDHTKAMVMHQVALSADPGNHLSANELGVLLAGNGRWQQAAELFGESLKIKQTATTWSNLAMAHQQLARTANSQQEHKEQMQLASLANNESQMLNGGVQVAHVVPHDWTSSEEFNATAAMPELAPQMTTGQLNQGVGPVVAGKPESKNKLLNKVKSWF